MLFVDLPLARRLEIASAWRGVKYARAVQILHPDLGASVEPVAGGYAIYTGPAFPVNRATGLGMDGAVRHLDLEQVEQFYRSRGAVPRVEVCPLADPSLLDLLRGNGYRLEQFSSVLVRTIPSDEASLTISPDVRVSIAGPEERDLWLHIVAEGFDGTDVPTQETLAILAPNFDAKTAICFLARIDGEPAGGGAVILHEGVAELCSASTRLAFRQRGVQAGLLSTRMRVAREAGCDLSMVVTSPGTASQRNVERAGFRLAYTKAVLAAE
jgi:GNAT superfamily N-acetyltransferase